MIEEEYFATKALSASQIKTYAIGGAYEFWKTSPFNPDKKPDEETDALIFGRLAHCMLFEPAEVPNRFLITDWGTKTRKTAKYRLLQEANPDRSIVSPEEYEKAGKMLSCLRSHKLAAEILSGAYCEQPFIWTDEATGLQMKAKLDAIKRTKYGIVIIDYKTSSDIEMLLRKAEKLQYPVQDMVYCDAVRHKYGEEPIEFVFIIQSSKEGEEDKICVANVNPESRKYAEVVYNSSKEEIAQKLKLWDETKDPNIWSAYPERVMIGYSNYYLST